jgi:hypothetical protein
MLKLNNSTKNWRGGVRMEHIKIPITNIKFNIFPTQQDLENFSKSFINFHSGFNTSLAISLTSTLSGSWVRAGDRILQSDKHIKDPNVIQSSEL